MKKNILYIVTSAFMMVSCASEDSTLDLAGMFSSNGEPVDVRFEQSMAYNDSTNNDSISIDMGADEYTVYVCSDSHITRKSHKNLDHFIAQYNAAPAPKLALHLGDLIDAQNNIPCADSIWSLANGPHFITPGNHDVYFKQWSVYRDHFHTGTYWFETVNGGKKLDLYICLDSADGTLGAKQMQWLRDVLAKRAKAGYRRVIVFTHTHFWKLDTSQGHTSNWAIEETYEIANLFAQYGVQYVWCGHQHARQSVIYKGVNYLVLDATKDKEEGQSYMVAEMGDAAIYHYIDFPKN